MQPHEYHEGEITINLIDDIYARLVKCLVGLVVIDNGIDYDWLLCRAGWCNQLYTACSYLLKVKERLEGGVGMTKEYDGLIINNCLSIVDDYEKASKRNFTKTSYVHPFMNGD